MRQVTKDMQTWREDYKGGDAPKPVKPKVAPRPVVKLPPQRRAGPMGLLALKGAPHCACPAVRPPCLPGCLGYGRSRSFSFSFSLP